MRILYFIYNDDALFCMEYICISIITPHDAHDQTLDWADKLVIGLGVASAMEHVTNLDFVLQNVTTDTCM